MTKLSIKNATIGLLLTSIALFSAHTQGAIVASYNAEADITVSSTFSESAFDTVFFDSFVEVGGNGTGEANGTGDSSSILAAGEQGFLSAAVNGQVDTQGFATSAFGNDGILFIDNSGGSSSITGDITIDISWAASILTANPASDVAYASIYIFIGDNFGNIVYDEFFELDSMFDGSGAVNNSDAFSLSLTEIMIDAGDFAEYAIVLDVFGLAEGISQVPAPSSLLFSGFALWFVIRKTKRS